MEANVCSRSSASSLTPEEGKNERWLLIRAREHHPHLPRTEQQGSAVAGALLLFKRVDGGDMEANVCSRSSASSLTPEEGKNERWLLIRAREHHPHLPRTEQQGSAVAGALLFKRVDGGDMEANVGSRSSASSLTPEEGLKHG